MNSFIVLLAIAGCAVAQYRPQPQSSGQNVAIIRQDSDISPDGSYQWSFEADNGISANEQGSPKASGPDGPAIVAQGGFQYTAPDGTPIQIQYVADENGFQPQGAHLPVAPPIPAAIQRSLDWNAAHPQEEDRPGPNRRF